MKLLTALILCLQGLLFAVAAGEESSKPNIILIISDDQSFTDYGFMGHGIVQTPRLDRMASESLLYTRGYVMPVCSPSLACLLTGKLPHQHGITGNDLAKNSPQGGAGRADRAPLLRRLLVNSMILPKALSDGGYLTFQTGKLWNATYKDVGFTHGMTGSQGRHGGDGLAIGRKDMQPVYDFIEMSKKQNKPFFIWHAPMMPHQPHNPPAAILAKYTGKGPTPDAEKYHAMIDWFDRTCGELDDYLDANDLKKNTVILYLADNGWNANEGTRGGRAKLSPYERGIRTPMFVRWPGKVKPLRDDETLASIIDFAPTILKLAGIAAPADLPGIDLLDHAAMMGRKTVFVEAYTHDIADLEKPARSLIARVAIDGWSKLIIPGPSKPDKPFATVPAGIELYDLKVDPLEKTDLSAERVAEVGRLQAVQDAAWKPE